MNQITEEYPVVHYNPDHYVPINVFRNQWMDTKDDGAERVENPYGRNPDANAFGVALNASAPFISIISMVIILINTMGVRSSNPGASLGVYMSSPLMLVALIAFIVSFVTLYRKIRFAVKLKNSIDFALLESARRYLTQRYETLPEGWEDRFISYLVDEEVAENRFSENYELTVKSYKGFNVVMVANINGEAPLKN